jgi:hypothetical protein
MSKTVSKTMSIRMDRENFEFLNELSKEQRSDLSISPTRTPASSAVLPRDASPFLYRSTASTILPRVTMSRTDLATRERNPADYRNDIMGFRVARTLP